MQRTVLFRRAQSCLQREKLEVHRLKSSPEGASQIRSPTMQLASQMPDGSPRTSRGTDVRAFGQRGLATRSIRNTFIRVFLTNSRQHCIALLATPTAQHLLSAKSRCQTRMRFEAAGSECEGSRSGRRLAAVSRLSEGFSFPSSTLAQCLASRSRWLVRISLLVTLFSSALPSASATESLSAPRRTTRSRSTVTRRSI